MNKIALLIALFLGLATDGFGATITRYVNPGSSGGDGTTSALTGANAAYASLSAFEAAEQTNLDTANNSMVVNCAGTVADTTSVSFTGWTTSATDDIEVSGDNTTGKWDTSKYILIGGATQNGAIQWATGINLKVHNIQVANNNYYSFRGTDSSAAITLDVYNCVIKRGTKTGLCRAFSIANGGTIKIYNNSIYGFNTGDGHVIGALDYAANVYIENNTIANCDSGIEAGTAATVIAINNIVYGSGNTNAYTGTFTSSNYNATDGTDTGDGGANSITSATLTFIDSTNADLTLRDYHLTSGATSAINGGGRSSSANIGFTDDIDGVTRSGTWDIGADEFVAAGGARRVIFIQ